jgi:hypothetical protein
LPFSVIAGADPAIHAEAWSLRALPQNRRKRMLAKEQPVKSGGDE